MRFCKIIQIWGLATTVLSIPIPQIHTGLGTDDRAVFSRDQFLRSKSIKLNIDPSISLESEVQVVPFTDSDGQIKHKVTLDYVHPNGNNTSSSDSDLNESTKKSLTFTIEDLTMQDAKNIAYILGLKEKIGSREEESHVSRPNRSEDANKIKHPSRVGKQRPNNPPSAGLSKEHLDSLFASLADIDDPISAAFITDSIAGIIGDFLQEITDPIDEFVELGIFGQLAYIRDKVARIFYGKPWRFFTNLWNGTLTISWPPWRGIRE